MRRVLFFRRSLPAKENMTPAGLAPAPVAVFTCSREARRLIKSGTEGRAPQPKRPARGREIDSRLRPGDARWIADLAHAHDQISIADTYLLI